MHGKRRVIDKFGLIFEILSSYVTVAKKKIIGSIMHIHSLSQLIWSAPFSFLCFALAKRALNNKSVFYRRLQQALMTYDTLNRRPTNVSDSFLKAAHTLINRRKPLKPSHLEPELSLSVNDELCTECDINKLTHILTPVMSFKHVKPSRIIYLYKLKIGYFKTYLTKGVVYSCRKNLFKRE